MKGIQPISEDERRTLDALVADLREEWGYQWKCIDEVAARWGEFVIKVEAGYELSLHDYTLELEIRDALEESARALPPRLSAGLKDSLAAADERLRFATKTIQGCLRPLGEARIGWWWSVIPRRVTQRFAEELGDLGIAE